MPYKVTQRVRALMTITEGERGSLGDSRARYPEKGYIHARLGDIGIVKSTRNGDISVKFLDSVAEVLVYEDEIEPI